MSSEFGGLDRLIREAVVGRGNAAGRFRSFLRASYGSLAGRSLVGVGIVLGGSVVALELYAARVDPGHLVIAAIGAAFALLMIAAPALPARRAWETVGRGVPAEAVVTDVTYRPPGDATTVDSIKNGFAKGHLRLSAEDEVGHRFESDASWAGDLRVGTRLLVIIDRSDRSLLANLGPLTGTIPQR